MQLCSTESNTAEVNLTDERSPDDLVVIHLKHAGSGNNEGFKWLEDAISNVAGPHWVDFNRIKRWWEKTAANEEREAGQSLELCIITMIQWKVDFRMKQKREAEKMTGEADGDVMAWCWWSSCTHFVKVSQQPGWDNEGMNFSDKGQKICWYSHDHNTEMHTDTLEKLWGDTDTSFNQLSKYIQSSAVQGCTLAQQLSACNVSSQSST